MAHYKIDYRRTLTFRFRLLLLCAAPDTFDADVDADVDVDGLDTLTGELLVDDELCTFI